MSVIAVIETHRLIGRHRRISLYQNCTGIRAGTISSWRILKDKNVGNAKFTIPHKHWEIERYEYGSSLGFKNEQSRLLVHWDNEIWFLFKYIFRSTESV